MATVMGVLNVTPDSFSDGGRYLDPDAAVAHGLAMVRAGADIVDVGGESTRPGATPVGRADELARVLPVVAALAPWVTVSIDTRKAEVAEAAIEAGATVVNDVSATLWPVAAAAGAGWVAMHSPADPSVMMAHARYDDVVRTVIEHLTARAEAATAAGVTRVWIDPGIGFGKTAEHNLTLLAHIGALVATGWPVALGTSRKRFLGELAAELGEPPAPIEQRVVGSVATAVWALAAGVDMVRVHDVEPVVQAVRLLGPDRAPESAATA